MTLVLDLLGQRLLEVLPTREAAAIADCIGVASLPKAVIPQVAYEVIRGDGGPVVAYLKAASATVRATPSARTISFTDGSLWLVGSQVDPVIPADGFVGIAFTHATLLLPSSPVPGPPPISPIPKTVSLAAGATIAIPPGVTASLEAGLRSPTTPGGSIDDDGAVATVELPKTVAFELAPDGTQLTSVGDASATLYGSTTSLRGGIAGATFDAAKREWVVAFASISGTPLDIHSARSSVFRLRGSAPVTAGNWRVPIARTTPDQLPDAPGSTIGLTAGAGLSAEWGQLTAPLSLVGVSLAVGDGWLRVTALTTGTRPFAEAYTLWDGGSDSDHPKQTSLKLRGSRSSTVVSTQSAANDVVEITGCSVEVHVDRPSLVDGTLPRLDRLLATYFVGLDSSGWRLGILASGPLDPFAVESYMLRNAVLGTTGVEALVLFASISGSEALSGNFLLAANLVRVTPTLPDPYAASLPDTQQEARLLLADVRWTNTKTPTLMFEIVRPSSTTTAPTRDVASRPQAFQGPISTLYDVSSASDQLGVTLLAEALASAQIDGQTLAVSGESSALFALPQIAWEAVITEDAPGVRKMFPHFAGDDGPSANVNVATQALRPMTPDAFLDQFLVDFERGADLFAHLTLPFGLEAVVFTGRSDPPSRAPRPTLSIESPRFGDHVGGRQLAIAASGNPYLPAVLPGRSFTTTDVTDAGYPEATLDPSVASFWNQEFQQGLPDGRPFVPLGRIAISGYGSSTFSDYLNPHAAVGVSEARFDVIVGRTSYALIQIQSLLCPWGVVVVNTTIFERDGAGWIQRRNTGWRAKSPGQFRFAGGPDTETGGVSEILNVRNIVELDVPQVTSGSKSWAHVNFDADVQLVTDTDPHGLVIRGGDIGGGRLAGTRFTGWIDMTVGAAPNVTDVIALMDVVGAANGTVAAEVAAGATGAVGSGIAMALSGLDVAATVGGPRTLAVALRGLPHLPRDGSWSVAKRTSSQPTPGPVDPLIPVPLVRFSGDPTTWHLAEPADVLTLGAPGTLYAIVQSTGTQKIVFEHPTMSKLGPSPLKFVQPPKLADVGALLGSSGLLPNIASLLSFPSFAGFTPAGDGLRGQTLTLTQALPDTTLIPIGPISLVLGANLDPTLQPEVPDPTPPRQSIITVVVDPTATPRWSITITNVAFKLIVDGSTTADPLVAVIGDIVAADGQTPTVKNLKFAYGSQLSLVKEVLSGIQTLADALPGGADSGLDVGFTGTKLRVRDAVSLPQLPLGFGYLEGISLDLGFDVDILAKSMSFNVGVGTDENPFSWLASPLAGNGLLQLGAGDAGLGVRMQGGIGVGLGIDLGIASGSASVCLAVQLDTTKTPFGIMVLLTGTASVDVLDGLASASLTLTAGLGVQVSPGPPGDLLQIPPQIEDFIQKTSITLTAEVAVAIHLTVAWLVHIDWSGSWSFSETVSGSALTSVLP